ncbi:Piso0_000694 [Millerozyma farinosa CBS 7064]|uniref:Piso0_000694 protein n=1 Tax=Pichia sorbitophila (strain ATCC MYA-4447 / BCRC 22081 / CBS 7064 / NBRC 10061 / NRRL Y-12695) TaxID=559304 RepID=G8YR94_PICSO|nr:Piso0_000694 [Millerozyma farinosa CBS 7064]
MTLFVSSLNIPIGYTTPPFPSIHWPLGSTSPKFQSSYLYYSFDIWKFTVFWSLIFFGGFYLAAGVMGSVLQLWNNYRHTNKISKVSIIGCLFLTLFYVVIGLIQGFCSGAVIGLIISAIYKAGSMSMSTWIPFCWGLTEILYAVFASFSSSSVFL